ncbi:hypothetical protein BaRGS_00005685 [Batillaria attramentaria]|uniref:Peptidase M12B domain-containing protein n=1 Tax=Batillaria attramentaria TaxID=370345 RepID=A0ABD0LTX3_9CAEN
MDWSGILRAVFIAAVCVITTECAKLNDYILDYQPLTYDRSAVHKHHERVRRSTDSQLKVRFKAYGRDFRLELSPAENIFSPDHMVYTQDKGLHYVDTSFIYQGRVKVGPSHRRRKGILTRVVGPIVSLPQAQGSRKLPVRNLIRAEQSIPSRHLSAVTLQLPICHHGEPKSSVHVSVINGSIEGHVELPETTYHIEPAAKYLQDPAFHSIIYPETHLDKDPYRARRAAESSTCAVDNLHEWMEAASSVDVTSKHLHKRSAYAEKEKWPHNIYSESSNREKRSPFSSSRQKRAALGDKNACPLHIRADPRLFEFVKRQKHKSTILNDQAEEEIIAFFSNHVNAITNIYSNTVFEAYDGSMRNSGLRFNIRRTTDCNATTVPQAYCENTLDVSNYLDLTSREDHDEYCLTFTFTYRDFSGGTLGLAWVATESNTQSGVCGRYTTFTGGQKKSLNTGIVTIINFGKTVPNRVSQLTFAHEVGHNFGSPHDIGSPECAPFGTRLSNAGDGNYIMFPSATSGDKPNNDEFSRCSKDNMTRIIQQVVNGQRDMCFTESGAAFCGNKITEGTEECDCGFQDECNTTSSCCDPKIPNVDNSGCTLTTENPTTGECISSSNSDALAKAENKPFKDVLEDAAQQKKGSTPSDADLPIMLPPGSACDNFRGYCDAFSKCERIDAQGPFNQLTNLIFDPVTLGKVKDWIVEHWWAVLLMAVGLVVFMGVFIKVFGYNTPSEDPKRKRLREERERARAQQAARPKQSRPPSQPPPSAPYSTGMDMDMAQYGRGAYPPPGSNQYDRIHPGYSGHPYNMPSYGKNHI